MNTLGQEQPVVYSMDEIFNPTTMNMVLQAQQNYVNAMREDYMQGVKDMKDFAKQYGDFYSPFAKDNANWDRLTNGVIREAMSKYGPDMLRSPEGRAEIQRIIASVPYGELAQLKMGAEAGKQYLKNRAELQARRKYNKDYENYQLQQLGLPDFEHYDTLNNGIWTRTSPEEYKTLTELTDPIYEGMKASDKGNKGGYRYKGIDENDLLNIAKDRAQYLKNDPLGGYYYNVVKDRVRNNNPNLTKDQLNALADQEFMKDVAHSQAKRKYNEKETDEFALTRFRTNEGIREHAANAATDYAYYKKKAADEAKNTKNKEYQNIFREADRTGHGSVHYDTRQTGNLKINSSPGSGIIEEYDKSGFTYYIIPSNKINNLLYSTKSVYSRYKPKRSTINDARLKNIYSFVPSGEIHAKKDSRGKTRYFISGYVKYKDGENTVTVGRNGSDIVYQMEVFEKDYTYKPKYQEP